MKVFDLQCAQQHVFEGWFGSEADYQSQLERALLVCPVCNNAQITKLLSAPRLNLGATEPSTSSSKSQEPASPAPAAASIAPAVAGQQEQSMWMAAMRHLMANTEDVGDRFADEARRMHHGDAPERGIRGQASAEEREALREEGIDVMHLPLPDFAKETLQ